MKKVELSIVIPIFNEAKRLGHLHEIYRFLRSKEYNFEIIVVNDGSLDQTKDVVKSLQKKYHFTFLSYRKNRGKGYAIRQGVLVAKGRYIVFTDIDLSVPIFFLDTLMKQRKNASVLIASRRHKDSKIEVHQNGIRNFLGRVFSLLAKVLLGIAVSDFTCGFKMFEGKVAKKIFQKAKIDRWAFDAEILFLAKNMGYSIVELPVSWKDNPQSSVRIQRDVIGSFVDLLRIRFYTRST